MRLKKIFRKILMLTIFLIFFVIGYLLYGEFYKINNYKPKDEDKGTFIKESGPKEYKVNLLMVGDALIHASIYKGAKIGEDSYDFSSIFTYLRPMVKKADLAFYNQETIIGGRELGISTYPCFNTPFEFADEMVDMGFNIVSLANNHSLDKGEKGILNSNEYWSKKDVLTAGTYSSLEEQNKNRIMSKNNITYSLLSYTTLTNGLKRPNGKDYLLNIYNEEQVRKDVERLRDKVDVLIVSLHWGTEYTNTPTSEEKEIANYLASLGVDIVIGHHPHVIQPIEYIDGTLVFYSLGNLVSAQVGSDRLTGMLASLDIIKKVDNEETTINIDNVNANFIYTYYKNWSNYKVIPFSELDYNHLVNYQEVYNKYNSIVTSLDDSITVTKIAVD